MFLKCPNDTTRVLCTFVTRVLSPQKIPRQIKFGFATKKTRIQRKTFRKENASAVMNEVRGVSCNTYIYSDTYRKQ
jgi:hypothetical protein